jgi:hypothetical protein
MTTHAVIIANIAMLRPVSCRRQRIRSIGRGGSHAALMRISQSAIGQLHRAEGPEHVRANDEHDEHDDGAELER